MLVKYPLRPVLLSASAVLTLLFWSGCTKYSTAPVDQPPPPPASPDTLRLSDASGARGTTSVPVQVNLHNVESIGGVALRIAYDSTILQPSATRFSQPARASSLENYDGNFDIPGLITFLMISQTDPPGKIQIGDGPILELYFDIKLTAPASISSISFIDDPGSPVPDNQLSDTSGTKLIIPGLVNGSFTVP